jgi:hypothetical protein
MRLFRVLQVVLILVLLPTDVLLAQGISGKVHDLYYQSVAFPEDFDTSIELLEASGMLRAEMLACLVPLRDRHFQLAQVAMKQCERAFGGDPQGKWECLKSDPNASLVYWADGMIQVINGRRDWVNTFTGSNMVTAKRLAARIQYGAWVSMVQMGMPLIRQMIQCP